MKALIRVILYVYTKQTFISNVDVQYIMVFTEVKERNGKKYYYRIRSKRKGGKVSRDTLYLGAGLTRRELSKKEKEADREMNILGSILSEKETRELKKIKEAYLREPKQNSENRYEAFCSLFTYNSTAIEGNTFTLQETAGLLFEDRIPPSKSMREINEIMNHREAFDLILKTKDDVSRKLILELHRLVVKNTLRPEISDQVGKYRKVQVYIRGTEWLPPKPEEVPGEIRKLLLWYSRSKLDLHPLVLAAYFHSAFEIVHPFVDGNGRVGRLLLNFILHENKYPMINIPNSRKGTYYKTLEEAQTTGNLRPFVELLIKLMKEEKIRF
jgi:Fic family protein